MATSTNSLIRVVDVSKEYNGGSVHALSHCNLSVKKGEVVAIIGPSGSGKSTLLRCLNLLEQPTSGAIYFKGIALNGQYTQPATLNIYAQSGGTGTLICSGPSDSGCAGIYDNSNEDGNETALNIYGGVITATGTSNPLALSSTLCGAGIGSIGSYKYKSTMTVNISGGTVTAKSGGKDAQAIGNGTNPKGTVTVKIAPGMKCVRTDDPNTACDPGNTNGTSVTVTKCSEHVWEYTYTEDSSTHTKTCTLCGTVGKPEAHKAEKYVSVSETQHDIFCVCGKEMGAEDHAVQYTPNADGLTHKTSCNRCGWTSADEKHTFGENGACVCGIEKSAEYGGQEYASLQAAVNAAAKAADDSNFVFDGKSSIEISKDSKTIAYMNENALEYSVYDGKKFSAGTKVADGVVAYKISADGKYIAFSHDDFPLAVFPS